MAHDPEHASLEDWRAVHAVNPDSTFLGCQAALHGMQVTGTGSIINISSRLGVVGIPMVAAYASSKVAILTPIWEQMLGDGLDRAAGMVALLADTLLPSRMRQPT